MTNIELRLMAYVDGELDAEEAREVEALIAADPEARRTVAKFREAAALLRAACAEGFYADGMGATYRRPRSARFAALSGASPATPPSPSWPWPWASAAAWCRRT